VGYRPLVSLAALAVGFGIAALVRMRAGQRVAAKVAAKSARRA